MAPRVVLPFDVALRDLPASADRGLWRRAIALAGAALLHAAVLGALIRSEPHVLPSPAEPIRVSLVPAPSADQSQALAPPPAEVPPPAIMSALPRTTEARPEPRTPEPAPAPTRAETAPPEAATPTPAAPYLPLNDAQRESLQKQLRTGEHDNAGAPLRETEVNVAAARSKRAPPLTVAEREKLQKQLHTGEHDNAGAPAREKEVNIAAALSNHAAALSAEEWKTLDKLYRVGSKDRPTDDAAQAIRASALSLSIALADQQKEKELEAMYSVGRLSRSNAGPVPGGRTEARLVAQVTPDLPDGFGDRAFAFAVVARLSVAEDGAVGDVLLLEPTPEPDLNQALVVALQKWHFYPAVEAGKPVASSVEIRFTLSAPGAGAAKAPKSS
jgi:TonB family protein